MSELIRATLLKGIESGENTVFSPLSLRIAAAMLARAASPVERERIEQSGIGDISDAALLADWNLPLALANGVWYQSGARPTVEYRAVLERVFRAEPQVIDFGLTSLAAEQLNAYTSAATDGMIRRIVTEQMLDEALAVLLNATLLKASWAVPFKVGNTGKGTFEGVKSKVDFMHKHRARMPYADTGCGQSVLLDREDGGTVQVVLPYYGTGLAELIADSHSVVGAQHHPEKVYLALPRVAVTGSTDCGKLLGVEESSLPELGIDHAVPVQIHQAAKVRWDETGVEAAAATAVVARRSSSFTREMVFNRPFLFIIRENNGTVSFVGVIYNPLG